MIEKQSTIYIAKDGKEFTDKTACEKYEKKLDSHQLWSVTHSPDLTEGRGYYGKTYLHTESASLDEIEDFCFKKFGKKCVYVQGSRNCKMSGWHARLIDDKDKHEKVGSSHGLSTGGYKEIKLVWDRQSQGLIEAPSND